MCYSVGDRDIPSAQQNDDEGSMQGREMWISSANHVEMIEAQQETAKIKQINKYTWAARITSF
jgi:hypothetical protein